MAPPLVVVAAIVEDDGLFLVTRRLPGTHLEGLWEFPGGKCGRGETVEACLRRELMEELGVEAVVGEELMAVAYSYADRDVELHFLRCVLRGTPRPILDQEMQWVTRAGLRELALPPADKDLVELLSSKDDGRR